MPLTMACAPQGEGGDRCDVARQAQSAAVLCEPRKEAYECSHTVELITGGYLKTRSGGRQPSWGTAMPPHSLPALPAQRPCFEETGKQERKPARMHACPTSEESSAGCLHFMHAVLCS